MNICPMLRAKQEVSKPFVHSAWEFYNWLKAGYITLTHTEFENIDHKTYEAFNSISNEFQRIDDEEREMRDLSGGSLADVHRRSIN